MRLLMLTEARTVHAQRWARAMTRRGWRVAMLSVSTTPIPGVEVIPLTTPPLGWSYPRRWWGRYAQYVRSTIRRFAPDVVHIHYLSEYPLERGAGFGRAPSPWSRRNWPPLVISTWGADVIQDQWVPHDTDRQRQSKIRLLRTADAVTATTRFLADRTAEYGGISPEGITVIPFGVDLARYDQPRPDVPGRDPVIGFVKHLEPKYGPEILVRAMSQVVERFPTVRLVMIGGGFLEQPLRALARDLDLERHIDWRGVIDNADVPAALAAMDLYVMPSLSVSETFGVTAVEAQAAGVPVVFSDLPGVREAVTDGVGGLAVRPGDVGATAEAICRLLADEALRRRLGCGGRRMVRRLFEFDDQVTQMEQVYQRVTAQRLCRAG